MGDRFNRQAREKGFGRMPTINADIVGLDKLQTAFEKMGDKKSVELMRRVARKGAEELRPRVVANLSGKIAEPRTGKLRDWFRRAKIKTKTDARQVGAGIPLPPRAELDIDPSDKYYYPTALEYGHNGVPPHPYLRNAIDSQGDKIATVFMQRLSDGITRIFEKHAPRVRR